MNYLLKLGWQNIFTLGTKFVSAALDIENPHQSFIFCSYPLHNNNLVIINAINNHLVSLKYKSLSNKCHKNGILCIGVL